ncbi:ABC transporter ATP-binding protein [Cellulomonas shaoxiangyii]|uniref:Fatty acid ABC transporter ATP-binding/permease protein n=1 Tax=Cellulomonas shaoxiangyii TaxID=2566013 RepID=A0A4P7SJX9_9CELL|nr:ABC transporter ATP-binding protein [Cellulomonas shaoxiangyii]TGY84663.1 ABC transporter ATP-binding protein [Cellulomonas shaoxiangyii]
MSGARPTPGGANATGAAAPGGPAPAAPAAPVRPGGPRGHGPMGMGAGMPVQRSLDFRGSLRRLLTVLRPERGRLVAVLVLGALSVAAAVAGPKLLGDATNVIFEGVVSRGLADVVPAGASQREAVDALRAAGQDQLADMVAGMTGVVPGRGVDVERLGDILLVVLVVYVAAFVLGWLQGRLTARAVQATVLRMRAHVEEKLARLPLSYYDRQPRGELLSRVTNDIDNVAQTMQQTLSQLVTSVLTVVGVLGMMFWLSPLLAVVALVTVPLSVVVAGAIAKRSQPQFVRQWASTGQLNAHIEEMFTGHALVTVFGRQRQAARTFAERNDELFESSFRAQFISGIIQPALGFLSNLNYLVIAVVGGLRVASGTMTLGEVQAFIQYSRQFTQPLTQIASMANLLQSGVASAERVFELLDAEEQEPDPVAPARLPRPVRGRVAFEHVSFRYEADTPLIEDLSVVAEPGQTVAIVGPTGAGKTTLVNLVMRFYEVGSGRITLDGVDTRTLTRDELRGQIGMVLQDTWLFGGTVAENIAYGVDHATSEQVVEAAVATHVDRFVRTLPEGYDTVLDDEGGSVSAGEKQLLTIARAFLADPAILILDEATSSVDTRTEVLVQQAMSTLRSGRTSFVIAHRLSTIRDADVILVMEHGRIVEKGSHDELLAAEGAYARLYASQFAAATAPVD